MSDHELGKRLYASMVEDGQASILSRAEQLDAEDKRFAAYNSSEKAVIKDGSAIAMKVGKLAVYQRCRPRRTFLYNPQQTRLAFERIGGGHVTIATPLFGTEVKGYNELAIEYGWRIEFRLKPRDGVREYPSVQRHFLHSGFELSRIAKCAVSEKRVSETWYTVSPLGAEGRVVKSHQAANDTELQVRRIAEFEKLSESRASDNRDEFSLNSSYLHQSPLEGTAGSAAIAHCQQLLAAGRAELKI